MGDYIIVAGHYPVFAVGEHGSTKQLSPTAFPHLRDNCVSAYLAGHDHSEQYIDVGDGIQYHVIGSAHLGSNHTQFNSVSQDQLKFHAWPDGGFAAVTVSKEGMQFKHFDASGKMLYAAPKIL